MEPVGSSFLCYFLFCKMELGQVGRKKISEVQEEKDGGMTLACSFEQSAMLDIHCAKPSCATQGQRAYAGILTA
jgi:hypothetical protein